MGSLDLLGCLDCVSHIHGYKLSSCCRVSIFALYTISLIEVNIIIIDGNEMRNALVMGVKCFKNQYTENTVKPFATVSSYDKLETMF